MNLSELKRKYLKYFFLALIMSIIFLEGVAGGIYYASTQMKEQICWEPKPRLSDLKATDYIIIPVNYTNTNWSGINETK